MVLRIEALVNYPVDEIQSIIDCLLGFSKISGVGEHLRQQRPERLPNVQLDNEQKSALLLFLIYYNEPHQSLVQTTAAIGDNLTNNYILSNYNEADEIYHSTHEENSVQRILFYVLNMDMPGIITGLNKKRAMTLKPRPLYCYNCLGPHRANASPQ